MPSPMWTAPLTRREIILTLVSLTVFIISFNLEASLRVIGLQPASSLQKFGLGSDPGFDRDGRRPEAFRDDLENLIFGDWDWEEGQVAGVESKKLNADVSLWSVQGPVVHNEFVNWGDEWPASQLVEHALGYTIVDSLVAFNGTFYIVTDPSSHWPSLNTISSRNLRIISTEEAKQMFPSYAGSLHGITLLSMDASTRQDSHTLPSLWRTYSSLDPNITSTGATLLPPPSRIGFPRISTFVEPQSEDESITLTRSYVGFRQQLLKTAFPSIGVMYAEDWNDLHQLEVPFVMERVVVADREASSRGMSPQERDATDWTAPFVTLDASENWYEPVRKTLSRNLHINENANEVVITYITRQDERLGPRLKDEDHTTLIQELHRLGRDSGYTINIVSNSARWEDMMTSILKSTVVLGVYGEQLLDGIFMKPSPRSTLMEFWPSGAFMVDRELPIRSMGLKYTAWWLDGPHSGDSLPPVSPPTDARAFRQVIPIDSRAVVQAIRDTFQ